MSDYLLTLLSPNVFSGVKMVQNLFVVGLPSWTPLGEFTALPRSASWTKRRGLKAKGGEVTREKGEGREEKG